MVVVKQAPGLDRSLWVDWTLVAVFKGLRGSQLDLRGCCEVRLGFEGGEPNQRKSPMEISSRFGGEDPNSQSTFWKLGTYIY